MYLNDGNKHAFDILIKAINNKRPAHGVLFYGEEGVGKKFCADVYAAMLECKNPQNGMPCGKCKECRLVFDHMHPDVFYAQKTGKLGAISAGNADSAEEGTVRAMRSKLFEYPSSGKSRVLILTDCKDIGSFTQAQNMLLKVLEEPPQFGYIIFTAENKNMFLDTILSRIISLNIRLSKPGEVIDALLEKGYEKQAAKEAVKFAGGNFGDAVKFLSDPLEQEKNAAITGFFEALAKGDEYNMCKELQLFCKDRQTLAKASEKIEKILRDGAVACVDKNNNFLMGNNKKAKSLICAKIAPEKIIAVFDCVKTLKAALRANLRPEFAATAFCADCADILNN